MIQGKKRETQTFDGKKIGLFAGKVICVNPSIEEYKEILGIELKEESKATDYLGEKDGNTTLRIHIWLEHKSGWKHPVTFFLEDKEKANKDNTKYQYINTSGSCSWADDENNLPDWFKRRKYRKAYIGEEELYDFLRVWLGKLNYKDEDTKLQIDWKKLMKGKVDEITEQIDGEFCTFPVALAIVKTTDKDGESKEYQGIYNKGFLPEYALKQFRLVDYNKPEEQAKLKAKETSKLKTHERFVLKVTGEYGVKDFFLLKDLQEYDPSTNLVSTNEPISKDGPEY